MYKCLTCYRNVDEGYKCALCGIVMFCFHCRPSVREVDKAGDIHKEENHTSVELVE